MRPRSRQLSKRRLVLPTITEGTEETVREFKEANRLHIGDPSRAVSSEDYFLSICHLACPTFPGRDVSPENLQTQQQEAEQQKLKPSRHVGFTVTTFEARNGETNQEEMKELNEKSIYSSSDPLEFLYGHQNNLSSVRRSVVDGRFARHHSSVWDTQTQPTDRTNSIPLASVSEIPSQRKRSCPEIHMDADASVPNVSTTHSFSEVMQVNPMTPVIKQSIISQWISDCRSTWREARVRACMLPAIAEI